MTTRDEAAATLRKVLADNVAALREARLDGGFRADAKKLGIGEATLIRVLSGTSATQLDVLESMADGLEVEPWQLLVPGLDPYRMPALVDPHTRVPGLSVAQQLLFDRIRSLTDSEMEGALSLLGIADPAKEHRNVS